MDAQWVPKWAEALQPLPSCISKQRMTCHGVEYTCARRVHFGCVNAQHHDLWRECKEKGCVACPRLNKHGWKDLFFQKTGWVNQVRRPLSVLGMSNLQNEYIIQLAFGNTNGSASSLIGVIGCTRLIFNMSCFKL